MMRKKLRAMEALCLGWVNQTKNLLNISKATAISKC